MRTAILLTTVSTVALAAGGAHEELEVYPKATKGMTRFVVELPKETDEYALRVQIIVGKTLKVDPVNHFSFEGKITAKEVKGFGYPYYTVEDLGAIRQTLMAVRPGNPDAPRFVPVGGEPFLVRYNSRLPIVVYAPDGAEVQYRIWRADPNTVTMPKG